VQHGQITDVRVFLQLLDHLSVIRPKDVSGPLDNEEHFFANVPSVHYEVTWEVDFWD
jgi:hypothetical protein